MRNGVVAGLSQIVSQDVPNMGLSVPRRLHVAAQSARTEAIDSQRERKWVKYEREMSMQVFSQLC